VPRVRVLLLAEDCVGMIWLAITATAALSIFMLWVDLRDLP
jgi:hypothetical protein